MRADARETWPSPELIDQFMPSFDFHFRLGEDTPLPTDDPEALAQARTFRDVLGLFATGVTVVTSMSNGEPVGMTCQSFSSVSLSPPLVMFCPAKTSRAWPLIQRAGFFCVNILASGRTSSPTAWPRRAPRSSTVSRGAPSKTGAPLLDPITGYVDCTIQAVYEAGDHYVVIGRVQDLGTGDPSVQGDPLLFFRGRYTRTAD